MIGAGMFHSSTEPHVLGSSPCCSGSWWTRSSVHPPLSTASLPVSLSLLAVSATPDQPHPLYISDQSGNSCQSLDALSQMKPRTGSRPGRRTSVARPRMGPEQIELSAQVCSTLSAFYPFQIYLCSGKLQVH